MNKKHLERYGPHTGKGGILVGMPCWAAECVEVCEELLECPLETADSLKRTEWERK